LLDFFSRTLAIYYMALYTKQITCTAHKKLWLILKNVENAVVEVYIAIHLFYITEPLKKVYIIIRGHLPLTECKVQKIAGQLKWDLLF